MPKNRIYRENLPRARLLLLDRVADRCQRVFPSDQPESGHRSNLVELFKGCKNKIDGIEKFNFSRIDGIEKLNYFGISVKKNMDLQDGSVRP